ncbi:MAG TPA: phage holin family protein [Symbiobacteriaceae bacterium]
MINTVIRFVVSAVVLMFVSWLTPGVEVSGFWGALFASLVIAGLGYLAQSLLGKNASPANRGFIGFLSSAIIIWLTSALFPGWLQVNWVGAAIAAILIGLVDAVVPTALR